MLSWYHNQIQEHGWGAATLLFGRVAWSQAGARLANKVLAPRRECPCCGWKGRRFYDYLEPGYRVRNAACPGCDSHGRHRALYLWLKEKFDVPSRGGAGLIFAPERALAHVWAEAPQLRLYRLDIAPVRGVDVLADVQRLPFKDSVFNLIWCHHVLEQVPDDGAAMRELWRVLRPQTGVLVISAGMHPHAETIEFGFSDKRLSGNRRSYGQDFPARLARAGFKVEKVGIDLTTDECARFGINPEEVFFLGRK